jgi:Leucine-rich repeat (LRR) protein
MPDDDRVEGRDVLIEKTPQNVRIETPASGPILNHEDTHGITQWRRPSWRRRLGGKDSIERMSEDLAQQLHVASELLLDRLFSYLSKLPEEDGVTEAPQAPAGLTLPASAVGWISSQLFPQGEDHDESIQLDDHSTISMSVSIRDRLSLLRFLLPRATHIRISADTWPPLSKRSTILKKGLWSSPANVNVSVMTLEEDFPRAFLQYFQALVHRPRIDMHIFPNCQALLVDQVPPDRIHHLDTIRRSLQVLRVERSCIYDLPALLAGSLHPATEVLGGNGSGDPLSTSPDDTVFYPKLTHVKLSHCGLNETSSLRGRRLEAGGRDMAPLVRLKSLQSLSLAHNELVSERTALAGLSSMPFLAKLDLSHNRIVSLKNAHYSLRNIQTLLLSHNRMRSVKGIDRLIALETLWLDHNDLDSIADASGLARLPELKSLRLEGNPFQLNRPQVYRVSVLDLFREQRLASLPNGATYRQLREALPVLDGTLTSMKELVALHGRTYAPIDDVSAPPEQEPEQVDSDVADTRQGDGTSNLVVSHSIILKRPTPVQRKTKRRQALVDLPDTREILHVIPPSEHTSNGSSVVSQDDLRSYDSSPVETNAVEPPGGVTYAYSSQPTANCGHQNNNEDFASVSIPVVTPSQSTANGGHQNNKENFAYVSIPVVTPSQSTANGEDQNNKKNFAYVSIPVVTPSQTTANGEDQNNNENFAFASIPVVRPSQTTANGEGQNNNENFASASIPVTIAPTAATEKDDVWSSNFRDTAKADVEGPVVLDIIIGVNMDDYAPVAEPVIQSRGFSLTEPAPEEAINEVDDCQCVIM